MLSPEDNKALTEVGADTAMGQLLRRYWHPIAGIVELEKEPTKEVRLLGEDLVLYRDRSGGLGLLGPGVSSPPHQLALRDPGGARSALRVPRVALGRGGTLPRSARGADRQHVHGARAQHGVPRAGSGRAHLRLPRPRPRSRSCPTGTSWSATI